MYSAFLAVAAALALAVVVLAGRIARAPGWKHQRELALAAGCALVYDLGCIFNAEVPAGRFSVAVAQACVATAMLCLYFWSRYDREVFRREPSAIDTWIERGLLVATAATMIPGLSYDSVFTLRVDWAGLSFVEGEPTTFGSVMYVFLFIAIGRLLWRSLHAALEGRPGGVAHAFGLSVLVIAAAFDGASNLHWVSAPLLSNFGFIAPSLAATLYVTGQFVTEAEALDTLRTHLQQLVDERTAELAQSQEKLRTEETLAALGRVASGVAHEINNPSAAIAANLRYIQEHVVEGGEIPPDIAEAVSDSIDGVRRITAIVRQMISSGRLARAATIAPVEIEKVVRRVVRTAAAMARPGIHVTTDIPANVVVAASAELLEQVLLNLLQNGVQAFPASGEGSVTLSARVEGARVVLAVDDNGPGIPPAVRDRIFEPFFTTKDPGEGSGLGLSVSRGLVRSMDGDLRLESSIPGATRFVLELPLAGAASGIAAAAGTDAGTARAGRVLIVDDDGAVRRSIVRLLDGRYEAVQAAGVNEALSKIVRDGPFEAIICDVLMPDGGGARLLAELKEMNHPAVAQMLFLTGGTGEDLVDSGVPILHKPVERGTLTDAIARVRARRGDSAVIA